MSCPALQPLMRDAARGRLDESQTATVAAHLVDCACCRILFDEELLLDRLLEKWLCPRPASLALKRRLAARLPSARPPAGSTSRARWWTLLAPPLVACATLVLGLQPVIDARHPVVDEPTSDHSRVIHDDQPAFIEGDGSHPVQPWFIGRLNVTVQHVHGGEDELTLVVGVVDMFRDHRAGLLVYRCQVHIISFFARQERGFAVTLLREGHLGCALGN